jgi:GNAT superfamily N-acetyltransferase
VVAIRPARDDDEPFLRAMLGEAVNWEPGRPTVPMDQLLATPELAHYVDGWPRPTDFGVVAEDAGEPVGAAWCRFFDASDAGYGFVSTETPEVTIGVVAAHRGRGIGAALLQALAAEAVARSIGALSLSVEHGNPARRLYERAGYVSVADDGGALTMRLDLAPGP